MTTLEEAGWVKRRQWTRAPFDALSLTIFGDAMLFWLALYLIEDIKSSVVLSSQVFRSSRWEQR